MHTLHVIAIAGAAWSFAVAAAVFNQRTSVVVLCVGVASTSSTWIIAKYASERLRNQITSWLHSDVKQMPPSGKR